MTVAFENETMEALRRKAKEEGFIRPSALVRYLLLRGLREDMRAEITDDRKTFEMSVDNYRTLPGRVKEFVERLIRGKKRKVYLIVDNAKTHHSKILTEWAQENKKRVALFYLPPYSSDLNPDEHINADVKYGIGSKTPKRTKEELGKATEEHMKMLRKTPERIRRYFLEPAIAYAADV